MAIATILAVEDNATHSYVIKRLCELFDYSVHVVATAEAALAAVSAANYAAVLMDISLPGMDGLECARRIRERESRMGGSKPVPIIAITSHSDEQTEKACFEAGMNDYLTKPFDPEHLRRVLLRRVYQPSRPNLRLLQGFHIDEDELRSVGG
ncbi:MAG: response regulator [Candidatus Obscuribacterales bacterium]|nr:response regulator [Candidatus Obscuribacterales bacterium]